MSASDFAAALSAFEAAARRSEATLSIVSEDQWLAPGARGRIADIAEHMAISIDLFRGRLEKISAASPSQRAYSVIEDGEVPHLFERADEPPGVAQPTGAWTNRMLARDAFTRSVAALVKVARGAEGDMRGRGARHPLFGPLDGVQWMLFAAAHTERHRSEILGRIAGMQRGAAS